MKNPLIVLTYSLLIVCCSCNFFEPKEEKTAADEQETVSTTSKEEGDDILENEEQKYLDKSVEVKERDVVRVKGYTLNFEPVGFVSFPDYYSDEAQRSLVSKGLDNWHERAKAIEKYLWKNNSQYFSKKDSTLILYLQNGKDLKLPQWDEINELGYNFENFFPDVNYYLLRLQFYEGDGWMLINRKNGARQFLGGRPYFSPDKKQVIAGNLDLEAGYSFNGLQYFIMTGDSLKKEWELEISNWGPEAIKWTSNNSVEIKKAYWTNDADSIVWHTSFSRLNIEKK